LVLKEKGLKYTPDIVILSLFLDDLFCNNLFSVNDGLYIKPKFTLSEDRNLELTNFPVPNNHGRSLLLNMILSRLSKLRNRKEVGLEFYKRDWPSIFDRDYAKKRKYMITLHLLMEIHALSTNNGANFLLVIIPFKEQLRAGEIYAAGGKFLDIPPDRLDLGFPQRLLTRFCRNTGIPVLDLLPVFQEHNQAEGHFFKADIHWTGEGHKLAAQEIFKYLKGHGLVGG